MSDGPKVYPPWVPKEKPWHPADYDDRVIHAVRSLSAGKATEAQQLLFWRWLGYVTSVDEQPYRPGGLDGDRDTAFASGKAYVGFTVRKMLHPELFIQMQEAAAKSAVGDQKSKKRLTRNA